MTAVKVGQIWRDKDKRRNTVIEILKLVDNYAQALVVGTEDERSYDIDRLVKRWELIETKTTHIVEEADRTGNIVENTIELTESADSKSGSVKKVKAKVVEEKVQSKQDEASNELTLAEATEAARDKGAKLTIHLSEGDKAVLVPERLRKKQPAYMLKMVSPHNPDYKLRITQKMLDEYGVPHDPWGSRMELAD